MSSTMTYVRTYLTRAIIGGTALSGLLSFYLVSPQVDAIAREIQDWNNAATVWTLFVGIITIFGRYIRTVSKREEYWQYQLYAMILIPAWIIMGLGSGLYSDLYQTAFLSTKVTLHIAILGQLSFFVISGAYRVFRIKTFRTAFYALFTLTMVICNAPWMLAVFPQVDALGYFLLQNPAMSMERALSMTGGIGGLILSLRILMGMEKGAMRATEQM